MLIWTNNMKGMDMRRPLSCLIAAFLALIGAFGGFLLGIQAPELIQRGILNSWKPFHLPNGFRAVRFDGLTDDLFITVETEEGNHFLLPLSFDEQALWINKEDIQEEGELPVMSGGGECRLGEPYREDLVIRPHLHREVDRLYCRYAEHAEYGGDIVFIIDSNGGIFRWLNIDLGYGLLFWFPVCGIVGGLIGAVLGLFVNSRLPWKQVGDKPVESIDSEDRWTF
jgi:hypothetical protein